MRGGELLAGDTGDGKGDADLLVQGVVEEEEVGEGRGRGWKEERGRVWGGVEFGARECILSTSARLLRGGKEVGDMDLMLTT